MGKKKAAMAKVKTGRGTRFSIGDLVFAKVWGWPEWPGKIIKRTNTKYDVFFYGTDQTGTINQKNLYAYVDNKARFTKEKSMKRAAFRLAIQQIECALASRDSGIEDHSEGEDFEAVEEASLPVAAVPPTPRMPVIAAALPKPAEEPTKINTSEQASTSGQAGNIQVDLHGAKRATFRKAQIKIKTALAGEDSVEDASPYVGDKPWYPPKPLVPKKKSLEPSKETPGPSKPKNLSQPDKTEASGSAVAPPAPKRPVPPGDAPRPLQTRTLPQKHFQNDMIIVDQVELHGAKRATFRKAQIKIKTALADDSVEDASPYVGDKPWYPPKPSVPKKKSLEPSKETDVPVSTQTPGTSKPKKRSQPDKTEASGSADAPPAPKRQVPPGDAPRPLQTRTLPQKHFQNDMIMVDQVDLHGAKRATFRKAQIKIKTALAGEDSVEDASPYVGDKPWYPPKPLVPKVPASTQTPGTSKPKKRSQPDKTEASGSADAPPAPKRQVPPGDAPRPLQTRTLPQKHFQNDMIMVDQVDLHGAKRATFRKAQIKIKTALAGEDSVEDATPYVGDKPWYPPKPSVPKKKSLEPSKKTDVPASTQTPGTSKPKKRSQPDKTEASGSAVAPPAPKRPVPPGYAPRPLQARILPQKYFQNDMIMVYSPSAQCFGIIIYHNRPESFEDDAAEMAWLREACKEAMRLESKLELGEIQPESMPERILIEPKRDSELSPEEAKRFMEKLVVEDKDAKYMERDFTELSKQMRWCLAFHEAQVDKCLDLLEKFKCLKLNVQILLRNPECVDLIQRMSRYWGNLELWLLNSYDELEFQSKALNIRKVAKTYYNDFKGMFDEVSGSETKYKNEEEDTFWMAYCEWVKIYREHKKDPDSNSTTKETLAG